MTLIVYLLNRQEDAANTLSYLKNCNYFLDLRIIIGYKIPQHTLYYRRLSGALFKKVSGLFLIKTIFWKITWVPNLRAKEGQQEQVQAFSQESFQDSVTALPD